MLRPNDASSAVAVNNRGVIIGQSHALEQDHSGEAFAWSDGQLTSLGVGHHPNAATDYQLKTRHRPEAKIQQ
jgi:probable HAF family extracellular repeat protein